MNSSDSSEPSDPSVPSKISHHQTTLKKSNFLLGSEGNIEKEAMSPEPLDISVLKFFWQSYFSTERTTLSYPQFLSQLKIFHKFNFQELSILTQYLHTRKCVPGEMIFHQGDRGFGMYFIFSGEVEIYVNYHDKGTPNQVTKLKYKDYFGELALLQEKSIRNATAVCKNHVELIAITKPDLDQLILDRPHIGGAFLKILSEILANRMFSLTREIGKLKRMLAKNQENFKDLSV